jgi:riboflavin synthase
LDGHWVTGHVDGVGFLRKRELAGESQILFFEIPQNLLRYCISKGSIAVDGISLTINQIGPKGVEVMIIPHTLKMTTLGDKSIGSPVNIETDLIGKYVQRLCSPSENS